MTPDSSDASGATWQPAWPTLAAFAILALWIAILSLPMLSGQWLAAQWSDQYSAGYAFRTWAAAEFHRTGHVPLWNPTLVGGVPFVGAGGGDIFYPTSFLRRLWPMPPVMNFGFFLHYILAGMFAYGFLRLLRVTWTGAVAGGAAFQLGGGIGSYPSPGHDGKLFAITMLPLLLIGLTLAIRDRRLEGYPIIAIAVGCAVLGHPQIGYYDLFAGGFYALALVFSDEGGRAPKGMLVPLLGSLLAVGVGVGLSMIQMLPLLKYTPYSPRASTAPLGFDWNTAFGIPWEHVPELFLSRFVGSHETYWGTNGLKLHSEYLGLPVVALAIAGLGSRHGRLRYWIGGIGLLFLLIALGGSTPFYQLWWTFVPYARQIRAPGMALAVATLFIATFAAFGVERLERRELRVSPLAWAVTGGVVILLAAVGVLGGIASSLAMARQIATGRPLVDAAQAAQAGIRLGGLASGAALCLTGALGLGFLKGRIQPAQFALGLLGVIGADLFINAHAFWFYSRADQELYRKDPITTALTEAPKPFRVIENGVYPNDLLMVFGINELLGYHGNELRTFDDLLGGRGEYKNLGSPTLWDLYGINYLVLPARSGGPDSIPGFRKTLEGVTTSAGSQATLYQRITPVPYARLLPAAVKVPDQQAIAALTGGQQFQNQLLLLDPSAPVVLDSVTALPAPLKNTVSFEKYEAGSMRLRINPVPAAPAFLLVSENYYPDWHAEVDGHPADVLRGDVSLLAVRVPAGAAVVELRFDSPPYRLGERISLASLGLVLLGLVGAAVSRRRRGA